MQPIAVADVLGALVGAATLPTDVNRTFDIGGPEVMTYEEMLQRFAVVTGLRRRVIVTLPVLTPGLASHWVGLVTPVDAGVAHPLVGSLVHDVVCAENDLDSYLTDPPAGKIGFDDAVRSALADAPADHGLRDAAGVVAATALSAGLGALATSPASRWYRDLDLPAWQPPRAAFPAVWTLLYADIALVSARTLSTLEHERAAAQATRYRRALAANLALNTAWSLTFWRARRPVLAAATAGILTLSAADLARRAAQADRGLGCTLAPYPLWCGFATALSGAIARPESGPLTPLRVCRDAPILPITGPFPARSAHWPSSGSLHDRAGRLPVDLLEQGFSPPGRPSAVPSSESALSAPIRVEVPHARCSSSPPSRQRRPGRSGRRRRSWRFIGDHLELRVGVRGQVVAARPGLRRRNRDQQSLLSAGTLTVASRENSRVTQTLAVSAAGGGGVGTWRWASRAGRADHGGSGDHPFLGGWLLPTSPWATSLHRLCTQSFECGPHPACGAGVRDSGSCRSLPDVRPGSNCSCPLAAPGGCRDAEPMHLWRLVDRSRWPRRWLRVGPGVWVPASPGWYASLARPSWQSPDWSSASSGPATSSALGVVGVLAPRGGATCGSDGMARGGAASVAAPWAGRPVLSRTGSTPLRSPSAGGAPHGDPGVDHLGGAKGWCACAGALPGLGQSRCPTVRWIRPAQRPSVSRARPRCPRSATSRVHGYLAERTTRAGVDRDSACDGEVVAVDAGR